MVLRWDEGEGRSPITDRPPGTFPCKEFIRISGMTHVRTSHTIPNRTGKSSAGPFGAGISRHWGYRPMLILRFGVQSARGLRSCAAEARLDEPRQAIPQHGCIPGVPASLSPGNGIAAPIEADYFCLEREIYNGKPKCGRSPFDSVRAVPTRRLPSTHRSCNCNLEVWLPVSGKLRLVAASPDRKPSSIPRSSTGTVAPCSKSICI